MAATSATETQASTAIAIDIFFANSMLSPNLSISISIRLFPM